MKSNKTKTERVLGGLYAGKEYQLAMDEAKAEFDAWEKNKRKHRVSDKAKFKAQRLAKLHMREMMGLTHGS